MGHDELNELLEQKFAKFFGQVTNHVDGKIDELRVEMNGRFDALNRTIDADTKRSETDEQERVMMSNQLDRHEGWIGQLAEGTGTKLVPEP